MAEDKDPQAERAEEEDVEGQARKRAVDKDDVEGKARKRAIDEDDTEGHRMM
jgi:hypothetical protein